MKVSNEEKNGIEYVALFKTKILKLTKSRTGYDHPFITAFNLDFWEVESLPYSKRRLVSSPGRWGPGR